MISDDALSRVCAHGLKDYRAFSAAGEAHGLSRAQILQSYIDDNEVVFGVVAGVDEDLYLIKGRFELGEAAAESRLTAMKTGAVPCRDFKEAATMSQMYGDLRRTN